MCLGSVGKRRLKIESEHHQCISGGELAFKAKTDLEEAARRVIKKSQRSL